MLPISLTIEGLYSYQKRQTIDFQHLTEAGLFGIFGAVGSGKSSILEAISFALYGETERLNARDRRAYNMMNLRSNRSFIEFDFLNFENKKYRATREFKRNSKNFEDVKTPNVAFYEFKNNNWIPLEHSNAEKIIGLSYANFKRTIIIPQGQFKEFLGLGATERTTMMKEIFNLQKFDLKDKVSVLNSQNKSELDQLEGELRGFENVNQEEIQAQKEILNLEKQKFSALEKTFKESEEKFSKLKTLKTDFETLELKKKEFEKLTLQKAQIDEIETKTELFDRTSRVFQPLISENSKLSSELGQQEKIKVQQHEDLKKTVAEYEDLKQNIEAVKVKFDALPTSKTQESDLSFIVKMLHFSSEIKILKDRTEKGKAEVEKVEKNRLEIRENLKQLQEDFNRLKAGKADQQMLLQVGNWFSENRSIQEKQQSVQEKIREKTEEIQKTDADFQTLQINMETYAEDFAAQISAFEQEKKRLSEERSQLELQQKLSHFAHALHDGEACPLCGSHEHPQIAEYENVQEALEKINHSLDQTEQQKILLQRKNSEAEKIIDRRKIYEQQLLTEQKNLDELKKSFEKHRENFIWKEFDAKNENTFQEKQQQAFETEKQLESVSQKIADGQSKLEKEREILDQYEKALEKFKLDEAKKEEQISSNEANLKALRWEDFKAKNAAEVENSYHKLAAENLETEQRYTKLGLQEKEISPKLAAQKTLLSETEKRIAELQNKAAESSKNLEKALNEHHFDTIEAVQNILKDRLDVSENRSAVQSFRISYESLKNFIQEFERKLSGFIFNSEEFEAAENDFTNRQNEVKEANNLLVKAAAEIARLEKEFKKKEDLFQNLSAVQKRRENLLIMLNLFNGAGFVRFVSSIYLRQLCDHANVRFHRMTRNQLSLQLNENNDFEIIDYLNEGRSRSVKTLSGGQAFQVSLSLALALAESVQSNAQAEKNFFFIDEGFGTQDAESVNVVFETLTNLQKENRIVGIISHVEELKEKIPVALQITKDEERGSLIEVI